MNTTKSTLIEYFLICVISIFIGAITTYLISTTFTTQKTYSDVKPNGFQKSESNSISYISNNKIDASSSDLLTIEQIIQLGTGFKQSFAAHNLANRLTFEELSTHLVNLLILEKQDPTVNLSQIFRQKMLLIDPSKTAQLYYYHFNLSNAHLDKKTFNAFRGVLHDWALIDIKSALDFIQKHFDLKQQEYYFAYLLKDNHFKNNDYLFDQATQYSLEIQQKALRAKLASMAPELAFEKLLALTLPTRERYYMFRTVIRKLHNASSERYLSIQDKLSSSNLSNRDKERLISEVFIQWANSDPEAALSAIPEIKHGKPAVYIANIMSELAKTNGINTVLIAQRLSDQLGNEIVDTALSEWANYDPQAAIQYIEKNSLAKNQNLLYNIAQSFGRKSPKEAMQWAENLNASRNIFQSISRSLFNSSEEDAQYYLDSTTNQIARNTMLLVMTHEKSRYKPAETNMWLEQYNEKQGFKLAQQSLFFNWANQDPQQAANASTKITDIQQLQRIVPEIAFNLYRKDPEASQNWINQLNNPKIKDRAIYQIVMHMAYEDIEQVNNLIAQITDENLAENLRKTIENSKTR